MNPVVNAHNEWDPLEEIIVGSVEGALVPPWDIQMEATLHSKDTWAFVQQHGGKPWPADMLLKAERNLEEFVRILEAEGVTVRRPTAFDYSRPLSTPDWSLPSSCYALMPRDVLLVIGDQFIEAPMGWRSRYFEHHAYKSCAKSTFVPGHGGCPARVRSSPSAPTSPIMSRRPRTSRSARC